MFGILIKFSYFGTTIIRISEEDTTAAILRGKYEI